VLRFPASQLRAGVNELTLHIATSAIQYDAVRLEVNPPDSTLAAQSDLTVSNRRVGPAAYRLEVTNVSHEPSAGPVTVAFTTPWPLTGTPMKLSGDGWTCAQSGHVVVDGLAYECTRQDVLAPGAGFSPIEARGALMPNVPPVTTMAVVSGGGDVNTVNNVAADLSVPADNSDNLPFPAYRVIGNIYYVGSSDIASYLVTTPAGHILINSGYEDTAPLIRDGILKLGFNLKDVKILLNSQGHFDHVAGQAAMQRLTGARIYSSATEVAVLETGGRKDPRCGGEYTYPAVKVDHVIRDLEEVTLGGVALVAQLTPGHSIGCTTWTMRASEGGKVYDVVIVGGTTINPGVRLTGKSTYPGIADDYARTFRALHGLKCDVFLGAHGGYYGMAAKYDRMKGGAAVNPFIDPAGYKAFIDRAEKTFLEQLAREKASK